MFRDYDQKSQLDRYEEEGIDDAGEYDEMDYNQRREIERELNMRDRQKIRDRTRLPGAFFDDEEGDDGFDNEIERNIRMENMRRMRQEEDGGAYVDDDIDMLGDVNDFEDVQGQLSSWVQKAEVIRWIRKSFSNFLRTFKEENGNTVYEQRIREMCEANKQSLEITFVHLSEKYPTLAIWLAEEPKLILPILNTVCYEVTLELFPDYSQIHQNIFARIRELPVEDKLRDLRQIHLNALIKIRGVVTKRTGVFPEFAEIYYRCSCGDLKGPVYSNSTYEGR